MIHSPFGVFGTTWDGPGTQVFPQTTLSCLEPPAPTLSLPTQTSTHKTQGPWVCRPPINRTFYVLLLGPRLTPSYSLTPLVSGEKSPVETLSGGRGTRNSLNGGNPKWSSPRHEVLDRSRRRGPNSGVDSDDKSDDVQVGETSPPLAWDGPSPALGRTG